VTAVVALLRGVNVGRAKRISSAELTQVAEAAGMSAVRTVLNSGNAVGHSALGAGELAAALAAEVQRQCGFSCDVVVRSRAELEHAIAHDPLAEVAADPSRHLLVALAMAPALPARRALEAGDFAPDLWALDGADLHAWLPDGVAASRLQKALAGGLLGVPWTGRNWTTLGRVVAAMRPA